LAGRKLDDKLERVRQLRAREPDSETASILAKALLDRSNLVVAEAAKTVAALGLATLIPDLISAFDRLFPDAAKVDPKCWGKQAIVKALAELDYSESMLFVRAARHVQMEPVWGGQEDSAPHLRANAVLALIQCTDLRRVEVFQHLVDAMSDPADPVRVEAVRAIHQLGGDEAMLVLRLKARVGDRRPLIVGHVFDAVLSLDTRDGVRFVSEYLKSDNDELRDEAAMALGASRLNSALKILIDTWKECGVAGFSGTLLRAISASRHQDAIDFLIEVVKSGTPSQSSSALEALKLHEDSPEIQALIATARDSRSAGRTR
jgi:HEAT repeat protein